MRRCSTFASTDETLTWSRLERANLVAATRQAAAEELHDVAWKLPVAIMLCFDLHGYRAEWIATHEVALASARADRRPARARPGCSTTSASCSASSRYRRRPLLRAGAGDPPGAGRPARPGPDHEQPGVQLPVPRPAREGGRAAGRRAGAPARGRPPVRRGHGAVQHRRGLRGARPLRRGDLLRAGGAADRAGARTAPAGGLGAPAPGPGLPRHRPGWRTARPCSSRRWPSTAPRATSWARPRTWSTWARPWPSRTGPPRPAAC